MTDCSPPTVHGPAAAGSPGRAAPGYVSGRADPVHVLARARAWASSGSSSSSTARPASCASGATEILARAVARRRRAPEGEARAAAVVHRGHHRRLHDGARRPWPTSRRTRRRGRARPPSAASGLMCSGTHPITDWTTQQVSDDPRYAKLIDDMQWLARQLQIFGVHVHVGVRSPTRRSRSSTRCRRTSRTSWRCRRPRRTGSAHDTGLASARSKVFEGLPTAGLPLPARRLGAVRELHGDAHLDQDDRLDQGGVVGHPSAPDLRHGRAAHLRRAADARRGRHGRRAVAVPGRHLRPRDRQGLHAARRPAAGSSAENKWRAARYGLDAEHHRRRGRRVQPVREALRELVEDMRPTADRLGLRRRSSTSSSRCSRAGVVRSGSAPSRPPAAAT